MLLTASQFADSVNSSTAHIQEMVKKGLLAEAVVYSKTGKRYKIDLKKGKLLVDATMQEKKRKTSVEYAQSINQSKEKKLRFEAARAELDFRARQKELVEVTQVEKEAFELARLVRDKILQVPDRISPLVAAEKNANKCDEIIRDELLSALEVLSES